MASESCWGRALNFVDRYGEAPILSTDRWAATSQARGRIAEAVRDIAAIAEEIDKWHEANRERSLEFVNQAVGIKLEPYFIDNRSVQTAHEASLVFAEAVLQRWAYPSGEDSLDEMIEYLDGLAEALSSLPKFPDPAARLQGEHYEASDLTTCGDLDEETIEAGKGAKPGRPSKEARDEQWLQEAEQLPRLYATDVEAAKAKGVTPSAYNKALARARRNRNKSH